MNNKIIDELIELYETTKNECQAKELFFDSLKENLREKIKEKEKLYKVASDVLKQYKVSCTVFLENKVLDFNIAVSSFIVSISSFIFSSFGFSKASESSSPKIYQFFLCHTIFFPKESKSLAFQIPMYVAIIIFILILVILRLTISRHKKEGKVRELLYALKDIENEENAV